MVSKVKACPFLGSCHKNVQLTTTVGEMQFDNYLLSEFAPFYGSITDKAIFHQRFNLVPF